MDEVRVTVTRKVPGAIELVAPEPLAAVELLDESGHVIAIGQGRVVEAAEPRGCLSCPADRARSPTQLLDGLPIDCQAGRAPDGSALHA